MTTSSCVKSYLVLFSLLIFSGIFLAFGLALGIFYSGPNVFVGDFVNFISNPDGSHTFDLSTTEPAVPPTKVIDAEGKTRFILKAEPKVILRNRGKLGLTFHPHVVLPFYIPAQHASSCILGESSVPYGRLNLEEKSVERCLSPSNQSSQPSLDNFDNLLQYTLLNPPLNKSGMATDVTGERPSTLQSRAGIQNILTSQFKGLFQGTDDIGSHPVRYWIFGTVQNENPQVRISFFTIYLLVFHNTSARVSQYRWSCPLRI